MVDRTELLVGPGDVGRADAGDVHAVAAPVIMRLPFIDDLVDRVLRRAVAFVALVHVALAEFRLLAADRDGTGENRVLHAGAPRGLEAVIHALDVQLEGDMRFQFANEIGQVDHPVRTGFDHRTDNIVIGGNVAAHDLHLVAELLKGTGRAGIDVHHGDGLIFGNE